VITTDSEPNVRLRVVFLTHYYAPERGAPQTRLRETINGLREHQIESSVVTGPPHYPGGQILDGRFIARPRTDYIDGVPIHRLPMLPRPNDRITDRIIDQGTFATSAFLAARLVRRADAFVVESPPLFLGGTAALLRRLTGTPYLFHVADPWPDFPIEAGVLRGRALIAAALQLESLAYRHASAITTVTPPLVKRLSAKPGAGGKVHLLSNAVEISRFDPSTEKSSARADLGWGPGLTLAYSGTVGIAQGLDTLIEATRRLGEAEVTIRVVGDGVEARALKARAQALGLTRLIFEPSVAADRVPTVLAASDGILVLLRRGPLYTESLPTKLLEGLAAGRPVIVSADGYPADLVRDARAGFTSAAEDAQGLADAIRTFVASKDLHSIGMKAAELARTRFSRSASVAVLADILRHIAKPRQQNP
jgi:glycosyltransferase involved in cell wall biosynthesis